MFDGLELQVAFDSVAHVPAVGDTLYVSPFSEHRAPYTVEVIAVGDGAVDVWLFTDGAYLLSRRGVAVVVR